MLSCSDTSTPRLGLRTYMREKEGHPVYSARPALLRCVHIAQHPPRLADQDSILIKRYRLSVRLALLFSVMKIVELIPVDRFATS